MSITAVIVAGGKGTRMGAGKNKVFLKTGGQPIICRTVSTFENNKNIDDIVLVAGEDDIAECKTLTEEYGFKKIDCIVSGGKTRRDSVLNGLMKAGGDIAVIHDGARALVTDAEINDAIKMCLEYGASAAGVKCKDTLKSADGDGFIVGTVNREITYQIQTPQCFRTDEIRKLHQRAADEGFDATDDCMIAEHYGLRVKISEGSYENIKLTTPEDMIIAEEILRNRREAK